MNGADILRMWGILPDENVGDIHVAEHVPSKPVTAAAEDFTAIRDRMQRIAEDRAYGEVLAERRYVSTDVTLVSGRVAEALVNAPPWFPPKG